MLTPKLDLLDGETLVVSPSQIDAMKICSRYWWHRYGYRRVKSKVNTAAQGGKSFDAALNHRYKKLGNKPVDEVTEAEMLAIIDEAYKDVELPFDEYRTPARYKDVVQAYNQYYKAEPFEVLGVQVPFAVPLGEVPAPVGFWQQLYKLQGLDQHINKPVKVVLQGILDLFIRLGEHVIIVDTKTDKYGKDGSYKNSAQMKSYSWALPELARLHPNVGLPTAVHATFINTVVIRPPYKNEGRANKSNDKPRNDFIRTFPEFIKQEQLMEWRDDSLKWVRNALTWVAENHFPQNERSCNQLYGHACGYRDSVCLLPIAQREMALSSDEFMDYDRGPLGNATAPAPTEGAVK